ncbi:hypothetical protein [Halegenticoccus soli]|uniref:hypothetical protein n=1 Tax=Halegenticoccus soli TaxID=1985678 RepID=UPI000C6E5372|nr:hypothetical protein [Halegenticoccus soli]
MRRTRLLCAAVLLLASARIARAHEVGGSRFDAPIPLPLLFVGAGATVAVTAVWLGAAERNPAAERGSTAERNAAAVEPRRPLVSLSPTAAAALRTAARVGFLALVVAALAHGVAGKQVRAENLATVFVWPLWFRGVGLLTVLAGSPWRVLSPWRTLYAALERIEGDEIAVLGEYPARLGEWPAFVGFVAIVGVFENLTAIPLDPRLTVFLVAGYALVMLLGGVAFGPRWFERADAFEVFYRVLGRAAPLRAVRTADGGYDVLVRPPWRGSAEPAPSIALVAFVVSAVYTVSFDGFTSTPEFQTLSIGARGLLGVGPAASVVLYLIGLAVFVGSLLLTSDVVRRLGGARGGTWRGAARAFAPTVIPIAAAYEVAHNYPYVLGNLGQFLAVGGTLLPGIEAPAVDPLGWLSLPAFWASQVALVVAGHVVAVVAAHAVAVRRYDSLRAAGRAHAPLVALMVGYTVLSLWIISRPVVA